MSNISTRREQKWILILLFLITPLGFYTKFYSGPAANWVNNSLGGIFYEIFWCLLFYLFIQNAKVFTIAIFVFVVTCGLEFLQLWHPGFLEAIRNNFLGQTILGTSFSWSDLIYYFIGSAIGYLLLLRLQKYGEQNP